MPNSIADSWCTVRESAVLTRERMMVAEVIERVMRPRLTAEMAIAKLRAFSASRDLIVAAPRTIARDWYALNSAPSNDDAPATLRSGGL